MINTKTLESDLYDVSRRSAERGTYLRRRAGAAALVLTLPFVPKAVSEAVNFVEGRVNGPDVSALTEDAPNTGVLTIQHGDTAWEIAEAHTEGDPRPLVDAIQNQPAAQDGLQPGDKIIVPTQNG